MDCIYAEQLAKSHYPQICIYKCVVCVIGLAITAYALKSKTLSRLVHPNAKVLWLNHTICTMLTCVSYMVVYVYEALRVYKHVETSCDYMIPRFVAFVIRFPAATSCFCQATTMFACALERCVSTAFPSCYERKRYPTIGIVLAIISSLSGVLVSYWLLWWPNTFIGEDIASTAMTPDNFENQKIWYWILVGFEVLTVIFVGLCFLIARFQTEKQREKKSPRLGMKYQTRENLIIVKLLLPCFTTNVLFNLFPVAAFSILEINNDYNISERVLMVEYLNQIVLYSIVMPLCMLIMNKKRRQSINPRDLQPTPSDHFAQLDNQWNRY